ncbi:kynurenine formamidase [Leguminivora glycinivorella]|uniref:kynurenine formamidase n=1 Tax=Leguminivora glycinivorella TaxID=1035111 RepID=UPI00200F1885|nr:kynurenine formamidase [Leguminivora glycinivorella]XP_048005577.1 kynurenine formamidase [Leguminivora glycinivorella]
MSVIMDSSDLEREYSPSQWSTRFATSQEVLQNHVQVVTAASEEATNNIPHKLEIEYGSTLNQKLDIFGTDLPNDSPILVYVHGGYWQELNREISRYPAGPLHRARVKTMVVGYDLCPASTLPEIVQQIQNAARFVFEYADKMGSRGVYFAGHSAGAHLVAKLLADADFLENTPGSNRLQGAFLVSGIYDLRELVLTSVNDAVQLPTEWAVPLSPQFDCYTHLLLRRVRLYILAGQNDSPVFKKQSREFYELLLNSCLTSNMYLEIKDEVDHFDIVECFANDDNYLKNLLVHDIRKYL